MTDTELWRQFKDGQQSAYAAIYKGHADYLLRYCYRITSDELVIEDAIHDLFVEMWKNRSTIGHTDNIRAYLTVALRRKIIKVIQKKQKTESDKTPEELNFQSELAIDEIIIATERSEEWTKRLQSAMNQLSHRQREVLYMKFYSQMSNEEISDALGINNQSVRNLAHRSIEQLKKLFIWLILILIN